MCSKRTMDTSDTKRIASDMVQELTRLGVSEGDSRDIVHEMTDAEILLLNEIYDGNIEELAFDIVTADRVILDASGHVRIVVLKDLRDTVMNSMDRLLELTTVLLPIPEKKEGMTTMMEQLSKAPKLKAVYLYLPRHREGRPILPSISDLHMKYNVIQYTGPPYDEQDVEYYYISGIWAPDHSL